MKVSIGFVDNRLSVFPTIKGFDPSLLFFMLFFGNMNIRAIEDIGTEMKESFKIEH